MSGVPKPTAPIEIDARLDGGAVVATATTPLDAEVEIEVVLPDGPRSTRGRRPSLRIEDAVKDRSRREILVRATVEVGGARLTRVVSLVTGDGPPPPPPGTPKVNSRGEAILEFGP